MVRFLTFEKIYFHGKMIYVASYGYMCCCSAGIGVLNAARKTMARMLGNNEVAFESAKSQFWVVDAKVMDSIISLIHKR